MEYHKPVLLDECIEGLNIKADGVYVDVTFGGGGHSRVILSKLSSGRLLAFDQDPDAIENAIPDERFTLVEHNFQYLKNHLRYYKALPVDGLLADLGVSSWQFDTAERGFSYRFDEPELDMRMDTTEGITAADVINTYSELQLLKIFSEYGEVENSRKLVSCIVSGRKRSEIKTVGEFKKLIEPATPKFSEYKYYSKVFQALRIEVNHELDVLKDLLLQSADVLKQGGRLVVISYHSLEDRLVKNFINKGNFEGEAEKDFYGNEIKPFRAISRKAIIPDEKEQEENPRSRSAKLRIAERL